VGSDAYIEDFETPLLEASKAHYAQKAQAWLTEDDTPAYLIKARAISDCLPCLALPCLAFYLRWPTNSPPTPNNQPTEQAERALEAEAARVRAYLHGATEKALLPVVVEELLGKHVRTLVDRCVSGRCLSVCVAGACVPLHWTDTYA
jgi:hypothetical protein